jgi:hypothetical protein
MALKTQSVDEYWSVTHFTGVCIRFAFDVQCCLEDAREHAQDTGRSLDVDAFSKENSVNA